MIRRNYSVTDSGKDELVGYLLNSAINDMASLATTLQRRRHAHKVPNTPGQPLPIAGDGEVRPELLA